MIRRYLEEIAQMADASEINQKYSKLPIEGVSIDTRSIKNGNLFVPITGKNYNGHDFIKTAIENGATAALWEEKQPNPPLNFPIIFVKDTLLALQSLAKSYRNQLNVKVIGITGSNGKTSAKDMLAACLSQKYKTHKTHGNFNNHIGVPLTILEMTDDTEVAVVEMGMSALGEIEILTQIAKPDMAIITTVSEAHLGYLKTLDNIATAKLEILKGLQNDSIFICNGDNKSLNERLATYKEQYQLITFGEREDNDLFITDYEIEETGTTFIVSDSEYFKEKIKIPFIGKHYASNALSAIIASRKLDIPYESIAQGFMNVEKTGLRFEIIEIGKTKVINDAYKSNPSSLIAALDTLYSLKYSGKKIIVLGDMYELGDDEIKMHREIGQIIDESKIDTVFTVGYLAKEIANEAKERFADGKVIACDNKAELVVRLKDYINLDYMIMFKASRLVKLDEIIQEFIEH